MNLQVTTHRRESQRRLSRLLELHRIAKAVRVSYGLHGSDLAPHPEPGADSERHPEPRNVGTWGRLGATWCNRRATPGLHDEGKRRLHGSLAVSYTHALRSHRYPARLASETDCQRLMEPIL